jgi:hypothetical protein
VESSQHPTAVLLSSVVTLPCQLRPGFGSGSRPLISSEQIFVHVQISPWFIYVPLQYNLQDCKYSDGGCDVNYFVAFPFYNCVFRFINVYVFCSAFSFIQGTNEVVRWQWGVVCVQATRAIIGTRGAEWLARPWAVASSQRGSVHKTLTSFFGGSRTVDTLLCFYSRLSFRLFDILLQVLPFTGEDNKLHNSPYCGLVSNPRTKLYAALGPPPPSVAWNGEPEVTAITACQLRVTVAARGLSASPSQGVGVSRSGLGRLLLTKSSF